MICANCGNQITSNHFRAGLNGTDFCSKECSYEAYKGFYSKREVNMQLEEIKKHS